jgi:hypothetical protein
MATIEELEEKLASLQAGPTEAEILVKKTVELEQKIAKAELIAKATAALGKIHDEFECVSFPDGRNVIIKRLAGSYYRMLEDTELKDLTRDVIMGVLRQAIWGTTVAELDSILERWTAGFADLSKALMMLAGAGRIAIVGKPSGS